MWADMIKRDLDACILQANDFSGFLELLSEKDMRSSRESIWQSDHRG